MPIDFAYAQARAQARLADRLPPARWRAVESSTALGRYLLGLRGTALAPVVQHFTASASPHAIERALRQHWQREVQHASLWVPRAFRDAVSWVAWLPYLDSVAYLLNGGTALPWMHEDDVLGPFVEGEADQRRQALESVLGRLPPAGDFVPTTWWHDRWLERLPAAPTEIRGLIELLRLLRTFVGSDSGPASPSATTDDSLERLSQACARLLHRLTGTPATVYCHLALTAIELMRLRGGLVRHSLVNARKSGNR
jgi:hypothetical protein